MAGDDTEFFFQFARGPGFGHFALAQGSGRRLQQVTHGGMAVLSHERDRAISKHGNDYSAAGMMDHFTVISFLSFTDCIYRYAKYATAEEFLASENLRSVSCSHVGSFTGSVCSSAVNSPIKKSEPVAQTRPAGEVTSRARLNAMTTFG